MSLYETRRSDNQDLTFLYVASVMEAREIVFDYECVRKWGMVDIKGHRTNLALLLSDQCVHTTIFARYQGVDKNILLRKEELRGSILEQLASAYNCIEEENLVSLGQQRSILSKKDTSRDYPVEAVREALINAVLHREYELFSSTIINVFDNRIEFISPGGLIKGLSLKAAALGVCQIRNDNLATVFSDLGLSALCGRGLSMMEAAYKNYPVKPQLYAVPGVFFTELPNPMWRDGQMPLPIEEDLTPMLKIWLEEEPAEEERVIKIVEEVVDEPSNSSESEEKESIEGELEYEIKSQIVEIVTEPEQSSAKSFLKALDQLSEKGPDALEPLGSDTSSILERDLKVNHVSLQRPNKSKKNPQHEKVMKVLNRKGTVKRADVQNILGVGQSRALAILNEMLESGLIEITGVGRCTEYLKKTADE